MQRCYTFPVPSLSQKLAITELSVGADETQTMRCPLPSNGRTSHRTRHRRPRAREPTDAYPTATQSKLTAALRRGGQGEGAPSLNSTTGELLGVCPGHTSPNHTWTHCIPLKFTSMKPCPRPHTRGNKINK